MAFHKLYMLIEPVFYGLKKENSQTQVARMFDELGIELIFADSPEAKGKIERMNETIQGRLLNDIKRFNI